MRHVNSFLTFAIAFMILLSSCSKDAINETDSSSLNGLRPMGKETLSATRLSAEQQAKFDDILSKLTSRNQTINPDVEGMLDPTFREVGRRAMAVVPTPCTSYTPLNVWLGQELSSWSPALRNFVLGSGMLDFPTVDALYFTNDESGRYFGSDGQYTQRNLKTFKDLERFWNIETDNIVFNAMHGNMLLDRERLIIADMIVYRDSRAVAEMWADNILWVLENFPELQNGDHPIFTFNAFAFGGFDSPSLQVPPKVIMGDGIQEAFDAIGYGDVATQAILAHEFGHQIQFQLNLFSPVATPENTRRTELMADAYAAYYLSHARGASMQWKRVQQFLQVYYNIGDCQFTNSGHHGTPEQRMAAAMWGYSIADSAQKQGHILSAEEFTALFEAQLPLLVAP